MSDYETILIEREGRVARVSFNRPDKLNSFNGTLRREFVRAAQEVNADDDIWVVVLTGAGRAFGAGADLSDTSEPPPNGCLLYTSPSPRDRTRSRMPSSA